MVVGNADQTSLDLVYDEVCRPVPNSKFTAGLVELNDRIDLDDIVGLRNGCDIEVCDTSAGVAVGSHDPWVVLAGLAVLEPERQFHGIVERFRRYGGRPQSWLSACRK
jgi:hypothetical protein